MIVMPRPIRSVIVLGAINVIHAVSNRIRETGFSFHFRKKKEFSKAIANTMTAKTDVRLDCIIAQKPPCINNEGLNRKSV